MDILIKGMEMPKSCNGCKLATHYFTNTHKVRCFINAEMREAEDIESRPSWCPLVELPEHGRLIDADALKNSVADMRMEKPLRNGAKQVIEIGELFGRIIDDAPTIVEANNGTDN